MSGPIHVLSARLQSETPVSSVALEPYVLCRRADGTTVSAGAWEGLWGGAPALDPRWPLIGAPRCPPACRGGPGRGPHRQQVQRQVPMVQIGGDQGWTGAEGRGEDAPGAGSSRWGLRRRPAPRALLLPPTHTLAFPLPLRSTPQYCWVHPEKEAAIQCILCLRCKVDVKKSYHCSPECLREHWAFHRDFHQQSRENGGCWHMVWV